MFDAGHLAGDRGTSRSKVGVELTSESLSGMGSAKTVSRTGLFFFLGAGSLDSRGPLPTDAPSLPAEASTVVASTHTTFTLVVHHRAEDSSSSSVQLS